MLIFLDVAWTRVFDVVWYGYCTFRVAIPQLFYQFWENSSESRNIAGAVENQYAPNFQATRFIYPLTYIAKKNRMRIVNYTKIWKTIEISLCGPEVINSIGAHFFTIEYEQEKKLHETEWTGNSN